MSVTSVRITAPGTPLGEQKEWVDITSAFIDAGVAFGESMSAFGQAVYKASEDIRSFSIQFTMTKRERRLMVRNIARASPRPALIHNGRKPR